MRDDEELNQLIDEAVAPTAPSIVFEYGGVSIRVTSEQLAQVAERALQERHTMQWGHRCGDLFSDDSRAKAVDWLLDELAALAHAAVGVDGVELLVS